MVVLSVAAGTTREVARISLERCCPCIWMQREAAGLAGELVDACRSCSARACRVRDRPRDRGRACVLGLWRHLAGPELRAPGKSRSRNPGYTGNAERTRVFRCCRTPGRRRDVAAVRGGHHRGAVAALVYFSCRRRHRFGLSRPWRCGIHVRLAPPLRRAAVCKSRPPCLLPPVPAARRKLYRSPALRLVRVAALIK